LGWGEFLCGALYDRELNGFCGSLLGHGGLMLRINRWGPGRVDWKE
jgi:hypothetical protein